MEMSCMGVRIWSVFMQLFPLMIITLASSNLRGNEVERLSLLAFKSGIVSDPLGILSSWSDSSNLCDEWRGITCGRRHPRVTVLDLQSSQLEGILSPHIGNLSFLRTLNLQNNSFHGTIPQEVGRLSRLQRLHLGDNSFEGDIPINISHCFNLQYLVLANNTLSGKLPMVLGSLFKLQVLTLRRNKLVGEIPSSFGNLSSLQSLSVEENNLYGGLMNSRLGELKSLRYLALGTNRLTGTIPLSIYNLSSIEHISVIGNQFHGTLPSGLGYPIFPNLQIFQFQTNNFSGPIPSTISNASHLSHFGISNNSFTGKVPSLATLSNLVRLEMDDNNLGNEDGDLDFLSSLVNCTSLERVNISGNNFQGVLPESISNFSTKLKVMSLGRNQLRGSIPTGIGNFINLFELSFEENLLRGPIPSSICKPSKLYNLFINHNQLSGTIPSCLGNLTLLSRLDLMSNNLKGGIPKSLGRCKYLQSLVLSQNKLNGSIPQEVIGSSALSQVLDLDLSNNQFTGNIPNEVGSLSKLASLNLSENKLNGSIPQEVIGSSALSQVLDLDLSNNQFTGNIPNEVGSLSKLASLNLSENRLSGEIPESLRGCTDLISLHLNGNMLHGRIPESLSSLWQIQDFDLSRNNFSGTIPDYLQSFPLQNLDLSFNDFEGEVPVFRNTSVVSLTGNRLCGGVPQLNLPKCISNRSNSNSNRSNSNKPKSFSKLKPIISFFCGVIGVFLVSAVCFVLLYRSRKARVEPRKARVEPIKAIVELRKARVEPRKARVEPIKARVLEPRKARVQSTSELSLDISFLKLSYGDLLQATDGFSSWNLIGAGSSGSVYWGVLNQPKERIVAVKVLNLQKATTSNSFIAECQFLKNIRHRNLVKLVTACSSIDFQGNEFKALVFEYMMHGNLDEWLHDSADRVVELPIVEVHLNLIQRVNIAIDIASALDYLHNYFHIPIVHCDLKPSNVLLEKDMTACVCDFGLASYLPNTSCPVSSLERSSNSIMGSIGYIAPEYGMGNEVSTYGDVYSYGILLLEMLTGKRPTDDMFADDMNLHNFVLMALPERVKEICDPVLLQGQESSTSTNPTSTRNNVQNETYRVEECLISIARIGVACSAQLSKEQMEIGKVLAELRVIMDVLTGTRMPRENMITA